MRGGIDEIFFMPDLHQHPNITYAITYLARSRHIDQIIPLDDYDVPLAGNLREHMRMTGLGDTASRVFRDKLTMRDTARRHGILVPEFTRVINYDELRMFMANVPPPWLLKPRGEAGAMGIKKLHDSEQLWRKLDELGDEQSYFVLEQFVEGTVFHIDSLVSDNHVIFSKTSKYGTPPLSDSHDGGGFTTKMLPEHDPDCQAITELNQKVLQTFGLGLGSSHTEFLKGHADGKFYFVETSARVGGASIDLMIEHASGVNLWAEWANLEIARARGETYQLPTLYDKYTGLLVCLAKQEYPDLSGYNDPEVTWRMNKKHHAGLIIATKDYNRLESLLESYTQRFSHDFMAWLPPLEKATEYEEIN